MPAWVAVAVGRSSVTTKDGLPPIAQAWREEYERRKSAGLPDKPARVVGQGDRRGICFQIPPTAIEGGERIKSGPFKGRIAFTNKNSARDIGKRVEDKTGFSCKYDPD